MRDRKTSKRVREGEEAGSGGPRLRLRVMVLTRSEGIALHAGDPGKWDMQINKTEKTKTALFSTRRGGVRGRAVLTPRVFLDRINPIQ